MNMPNRIWRKMNSGREVTAESYVEERESPQLFIHRLDRLWTHACVRELQ